MSKKRRQNKIDKQKKVSKCNWGARKRSHNHIDQFFIIIVFFIIFLFIFFYYFFINFFIIFFHLIFFYYFFYLLFFLGWWSWLSPLTKLIKNKWNINKPSIACVLVMKQRYNQVRNFESCPMSMIWKKCQMDMKSCPMMWNPVRHSVNVPSAHMSFFIFKHHQK